MKHRNSISLPDISSKTYGLRSSASFLLLNSASTSTPHQTKAKKTCSPVKATTTTARKNISVIIEEKENPNAAAEKAAVVAAAGSRSRVPRFKSAGVQCNLMDELIVTGDDIDNTPYWKMLAHKRFKALEEAREETIKVNSQSQSEPRVNLIDSKQL